MRCFLLCLCIGVAVYQQPVAGLTISSLDHRGGHGLASLFGGVDLRDYQNLVAGFGAPSVQRGPSRYADLDTDGWVGLADFFLFADRFGHYPRPSLTQLSGGREQGVVEKKKSIAPRQAQRRRLNSPFPVLTFAGPPLLALSEKPKSPAGAALGTIAGPSLSVVGPIEPSLLAQIPPLDPSEQASFPVPESTTLVLFAAGLVGVFCGARWFRAV